MGRQGCRPYGGVTARRDPDAGEVIRVNPVFDELASPALVHVDAACLAVVDVTLHHRRVGARLHLEASDAIVVDVIAFEVALPTKQKTALRSYVMQTTRKA